MEMNDKSGFGPQSPLEAVESAIPFKKSKRNMPAPQTFEPMTPEYDLDTGNSVRAVTQKNIDVKASRGSDKKTTKKKNRNIYQLPQVSMIPTNPHNQSQIALK